MVEDIEKIIKQAVDEVNRKYEQEALDRAEQKGIEKGIEKGFEKWFEKGREEAAKDIAKNLKGTLSIEEISEITDLSPDTIKSL